MLSTSRTPCPRSSSSPHARNRSALLDLFAAPVLAAAFALHSRPMPETDSALLDKLVAPVLAASFFFITIDPCLIQTPPCTTYLPHPSWLQRFTLAPCLIQTPPCTTNFPHPSWLHSFTIAPCLRQTPPCTTVLPHPSWLQRLRFFAPLFLPCLTPRTHIA